jgi:hemolysin III
MSYPHSTRETMVDGLIHLATLSAVYWGALYFAAQGAPFYVTVYLYLAGSAFVASALYHMTPFDRLRPMLHRIDHAAIYFKIAGTYTPLVVMVGTGFGYLVLAMVWLIACVAAFAKLTVWRANGRGSLALYLALGWVSVLLVKPIADHLGLKVLGLIIAGGLLYTLGSVIFSRPAFRYQNPLWHVFVLAASACCFAAIATAHSQRLEIHAHTGLYVPEPVATQVLAPVPACHDDQMIAQVLAFEHAQNDHACAAFPVVSFERPAL